MKPLNTIKYKNTLITLYTNGNTEGNFPYEYSFEQKGANIWSRTSYNCLDQCLQCAKDDYDLEEN